METKEIPQNRWNKAIRAGKARLMPLAPEINLDTVSFVHY